MDIVILFNPTLNGIRKLHWISEDVVLLVHKTTSNYRGVRLERLHCTCRICITYYCNLKLDLQAFQKCHSVQHTALLN